MEIKDLCIRILSADTLEEKLFTPSFLTDERPGSPILWDTPSRPIGMEFKKHSKKEKLPKFHEHGNPDKRAVCLHRFAGHELLAFPETPKHFRKGLVNTLKEEQEHVRLYKQRLLELGVRFGDMPLYEQSFTRHDDIASELLMRRIFEDEISHVSFGASWLKKMKAPEESPWDCWRNHTPDLLPVARAKGSPFLEEPRLKAGIPKEWILKMKKAKYTTM